MFRLDHGGFGKEIYDTKLFSKKYETKDPPKTANKICF